MGHTGTLVVFMLSGLQCLVVVPVTSILNVPSKSNLNANKEWFVLYETIPPTWPTFLIEISHILAKPRHMARVTSFNIVGGRSCQEVQPQYTIYYGLQKICL